MSTAGEQAEQDVAAVVAMIHDITNRVILPAKEKGAAFAAERAQAFLAAQSRANEANRGSEICNHSVPALCDVHDIQLPM